MERPDQLGRRVWVAMMEGHMLEVEVQKEEHEDEDEQQRGTEKSHDETKVGTIRRFLFYFHKAV